MVEMRLEPGATVVQNLRASYNGFLYVMAGAGRLGADETAVKAGQVAWLTRVIDDVEESEIRVTADTPLHAALWAGQRIREPVFAYGPFVMNTEAEIVQAFADYRAGRLGR